MTPGRAGVRIDGAHVLAFLRGHRVEADEVTPYRHGVASRNFRARGRGGVDVTVRCDLRRSLATVQQDRVFSELAYEMGIDVPRGPWLDGHIHDVPATARPTLAGGPLSELDRAPAVVPERLGRLLGILHSIEDAGVRRGFFYGALFDDAHILWSGFENVTTTFADVPALAALLREGLDRVRRVPRSRRQLLRSPTCVIHGDFTPSNILIDGDQVAVIDWEKACTGPMLSDVAQATYYFAAHFHHREPDFTGAFLAGYSQPTKLDARALRCWLELYPAFIFLGDAVSAMRARQLGEIPIGVDREAYLVDTSAPRFRAFLEMEAEIRWCVGDVVGGPAG